LACNLVREADVPNVDSKSFTAVANWSSSWCNWLDAGVNVQGIVTNISEAVRRRSHLHRSIDEEVRHLSVIRHNKLVVDVWAANFIV